MRAWRDVLNDNVRLSCPREKSIEDLRPGTWRVLRRGFPDPSFASPYSGGSDRGLEDAVTGLEGSLPSAGFDAETLSRPSLLGVDSPRKRVLPTYAEAGTRGLGPSQVGNDEPRPVHAYLAARSREIPVSEGGIQIHLENAIPRAREGWYSWFGPVESGER